MRRSAKFLVAFFLIVAAPVSANAGQGEIVFCAQGVQCTEDGRIAGPANDPMNPCYQSWKNVCEKQSIEKQCDAVITNHQEEISRLKKQVVKFRKQLRRAKGAKR